MTDKIGAAGAPTGAGCTEPGSCFSVYYSCTTPLAISGATPRAEYSCPSAPPADWPTAWTSADTGGVVEASTAGVYRREIDRNIDGWLGITRYTTRMLHGPATLGPSQPYPIYLPGGSQSEINYFFPGLFQS